MKNYIVVNRISNLVVWRGSEDEAKQLTGYNPFLKTEDAMKLYHAPIGNDVYVRI